MCGIAGAICFHGQARPEDEAAVRRMLTLQRHRGPDGEGLKQSHGVTLGHGRLAIIDLSTNGLQPMTNETSDIDVIFNGEIYNYPELRGELLNFGHSFRSGSDTEVLLHGYEQWGIEGLLARLRGMFAFVLHDYRDPQVRVKVFLARDRLGIKPLYYATQPDRLVFASEVRSLSRSGLVSIEQNPAALYGLLCLGSVPAPETWLKQVRSLAPGAYLRVEGPRVSEHTYWSAPAKGEVPAESLADIFRDTVRRHLMSDVPIGIFLSGGLDSAGVVAAAAALHNGPVNTLNISFAEAKFDESAAAAEFARAFGTHHHKVPVNSADFAAALPQVLAAMDQPTADGVNTWFVSRAAAQQGLKVVLSGLGGDEVFLGYAHYHRMVKRSGAFAALAALPSPLRSIAGRLGESYGQWRGADNWQRMAWLASGPSLNENLYLLQRGFFPPAHAARLAGAGVAEVEQSIGQSFAALGMEPGNGHVDVRRFNRIELRRYLHDQLLRDSDVFSMAHSIELRVPLIDHVLLEAGMAYSPEQRVSATVNKPLLLEAVNHPVVSAAASRPKQGFTFPFAEWLLAQAPAMEAMALEHTPLDAGSVRETWQLFRDRRLHWSRAWSTVVAAQARFGN
jgi:asparagine synthase (glutamine-hydrolysing)